MEDKEFNVEDLDNLYGGMPFAAVVEKTEENKDILRKNRIEDLKADREILLNFTINPKIECKYTRKKKINYYRLKDNSILNASYLLL